MAQPLTEFSPIKLGLPMGAMESEVLALMNAADLKVDRLTPHYAIIDDPRVSDGVFSEPRDLWTMVAQGTQSLTTLGSLMEFSVNRETCGRWWRKVNLTLPLSPLTM